jgi:hypothetical protein
MRNGPTLRTMDAWTCGRARRVDAATARARCESSSVCHPLRARGRSLQSDANQQTTTVQLQKKRERICARWASRARLTSAVADVETPFGIVGGSPRRTAAKCSASSTRPEVYMPRKATTGVRGVRPADRQPPPIGQHEREARLACTTSGHFSRWMRQVLVLNASAWQEAILSAGTLR